MTNNEAYNGWPNYETWAVNLWLNNDKSTYDYWVDRAKELEKEKPTQQTDSTYSDNAIPLADEIKITVEAQNPAYNQLDNEPASVWIDFLHHSICRVVWERIAEAFLEIARDNK